MVIQGFEFRPETITVPGEEFQGLSRESEVTYRNTAVMKVVVIEQNNYYRRYPYLRVQLQRRP